MSEADLPKNVLIVGESAMATIESELAATCPTWRVSRAHSMLQATAMVDDDDALDAVVAADARADLNVMALFEDITDSNPRLARIVVTDVTDSFRMSTLLHEKLNRPVDSIDLRDAIERSTAVQIRLHDPALMASLADVVALPSPPAFAIELNGLLTSRDVEIGKVAALIETDAATTGAILRLVNSAAFGLRRHFGDVGHAIAYLGLQSVANLANAVLVIGAMPADQVGEVQLINAHSNDVAARTRAHCDDNDACVAGLLHDVGLLALATCAPQTYVGLRDSISAGASLAEAESEILGTSHATIGAWILDTWNFPWNIVEAVARSHDADTSPVATSRIARAVHAAESSAALEPGPWWEPVVHGSRPDEAG